MDTNGHGVVDFISNSLLDLNKEGSTHYLLNDTLYFKVEAKVNP